MRVFGYSVSVRHSVCANCKYQEANPKTPAKRIFAFRRVAKVLLEQRSPKTEVTKGFHP